MDMGFWLEQGEADMTTFGEIEPRVQPAVEILAPRP